MKAALVVNAVTTSIEQNRATLLRLGEEAVDAGAQLIVFPEAALTGLINDDNPAHDLPLGQYIPGSFTEELSTLCQRRQVWLACGLLERVGDCLYDSTVLIGSDGMLRLHYRRMQPQWHGRHADPTVYRQGDVLPFANTPFGRVGILICGDLFDDANVAKARALNLDWLLYPMARCFNDGQYDQMRWERDELPAYCERAVKVGCPVLLVNYLADGSLMGGSFGGAAVLLPNGAVAAQHPLGVAGMLIVELDAISESG